MSAHAELIKRLQHVAAYMADATGMTVEPPKNESWPKLLVEAATVIERLDQAETRLQELLAKATRHIDPTSSDEACKLCEAIATAGLTVS